MASEVTAQMIKDLRERTGAGMADCKKALTECATDMEKAIEYLRKKGIASAAKKATRIAAEGTIASYLHGSRIGVMVEVNCETDFVARNPDFVAFAKEIAMQVAALNPQYVSQDEIPASVLEKEKSIRIEQAKTSGKPEAVWGKIVDGQIAKWSKEVCLLDQVWVKDPEGKKDIRALLDRPRRQDRRERQGAPVRPLRGRRGAGEALRRLRRRGPEASRPGLDKRWPRGRGRARPGTTETPTAGRPERRRRRRRSRRPPSGRGRAHRAPRRATPSSRWRPG